MRAWIIRWYDGDKPHTSPKEVEFLGIIAPTGYANDDGDVTIDEKVVAYRMEGDGIRVRLGFPGQFTFIPPTMAIPTDAGMAQASVQPSNPDAHTIESLRRELEMERLAIADLNRKLCEADNLRTLANINGEKVQKELVELRAALAKELKDCLEEREQHAKDMATLKGEMAATTRVTCANCGDDIAFYIGPVSGGVVRIAVWGTSHKCKKGRK